MTLLNSPGIEDIADKIASGNRLSIEDGVRLFDHSNLPDLAALSTVARGLMQPEKIVTYAPGLRLGWEELSDTETVERKIGFLKEAGGTEIVVSGDVPETWGMSNAIEAIRSLKRLCGGMDLLALSPMEIARLTELQAEGTVAGSMEALKAAGLDRLAPWNLHSLPGLDEGPSSASIVERGMKSPLLTSLQAARDADIAGTVHVYLAPSQTPAYRLDQLLYIRELQETTGAFLTVTPLNLDETGQTAGAAVDYLRTVALTRLIVDNVPHVRSSIETQGLKIAQMGLEYGADDFGLIALDVNAAGQPEFSVSIPELERNIQEAGFLPRCRNSRYEERPVPDLPAESQPITLHIDG